MRLVATSLLVLFLVGDGTADQPRAKKITFDELAFDAPHDLSQLPPRIESLRNKPIQIRGYIFGRSMSRGTGTRFVLVRDNREFYPWPITDNLGVTMRRGHEVRFTARPIAVTGTFRVVARQKGDGGSSILYFLDDAVVSDWKSD